MRAIMEVNLKSKFEFTKIRFKPGERIQIADKNLYNEYGKYTVLAKILKVEASSEDRIKLVVDIIDKPMSHKLIENIQLEVRG